MADARASLYYQLDPSNPNTPLFLPALNEISQRIINSGQWKNMYGQVDYQQTTGYITLPRQWESIIGVTYVNNPGEVFSQMTEFMTSGPGYFDQTDINLRDIIDQGDCCTQVFQTDGGFPQFTISNPADAGVVVRVYGYYTDGSGPVYDSSGVEGFDVTLANPTVTTSVDMFVTQIVKPATTGYVTMNVVVNGTPTLLSIYQPSETNPIYRRYKVGTITPRDDNKPVLRCKVKRRFVKMVAETDLVWPDNISALKFALIAWTLENQGAHELQNSELFWGKCYQVLNQGLKQNKGSIRPLLAFDWPFSAGNTLKTH